MSSPLRDGAGRRTKPVAQVFTELLQLRLTPDQRDAVASLAAEEQRPVAVMARLLIERGLTMTQRNDVAKRAIAARKSGR
ncbi:MAG: hypothetical protein WB562_16990 [Candidatus Sulfotelmatobacter sp.]